jgi:glycosyltransferase involved in cell wall biosynthesis
VLRDRHTVRLLLGSFDPRRTYPELAALPHSRLARLQWPLTRVSADAIVTNSFGANLLALRNGSRVVYWVHSTRSIFLHPGARRFDLLLRRALDWIAVFRAAQIVANSRYTAEQVRRLYRRDADAVVYPGVDLELFKPARAAHHSAYAITVGRLSPEKGLDRLFEIWRDVPDLPLQVVGSGPPDVVRELRTHAPRAVLFRGALNGSELAEAYRAAALAVFAPYAEEFGLAPLEAMASGVPVVAWREGGLAETVVEGETGYLVSDPVTLRQRIRLLLHDPDRRHAFGLAARRRAEQFTWQRSAAGIEVACQYLSARPAPAPRA